MHGDNWYPNWHSRANAEVIWLNGQNITFSLSMHQANESELCNFSLLHL